MDEFEKFLLDNREKWIEKREMLCFRKKRIPLFRPNPNPTSLGLGIDPELESKFLIPSPEGLAEAESRLGCVLPAGYKTFAKVLGPGVWANARIRPPDFLCEVETTGFPDTIPLADGVDGVGGLIAFNRQDQKIYYLCVVEFGFGIAAGSFEDWIYGITHLFLNDPRHEPAYFYGEIEVTLVELP